MSLCKCTVARRLITGKANPAFASVVGRRTFFSRKKLPEDLEEERRKITEDDGSLTKERLNYLASKSRTLTTRKAYAPPPDVEDRVRNVVKGMLGAQMQEDWYNVPLKDGRFKYNVLSKLIGEFDHDISNCTLGDMKTVKDAIKYFQTEVRQTSKLEDMKSLNLPPNLHIQTEPVRFNPETDTMFGGRTAFPGSQTVVSSIKYRRKYEAFNTLKVKPGYENHYYKY